MRSTLVSLFLAFFLVAAPTARAGTRLGTLPAGGIAHSTAGPSDELIGFLLFDPALIADRVPAGVRLRTLEERARGWPRLAAYLERHPERRGWAWSFYEIIGIRAARYDDVTAAFDAGRGGMAVWYPELVRTDASDPRPVGEQNLALGSWVSDPSLVKTMRTRGFPAREARITFIADDKLASGTLETEGLTIRGECGLEGRPFVPWWGKDKHSYETMWTPAGEGDTFEIVTWAGHKSRRCVDATWRVTGTDPFAILFNDPARGDPNFLPTEFAFGYDLESALYERHPNLYAQVAAKLAANPALGDALGKPGPEMTAMSWLLGDWDVVSEIQAPGQADTPEHGTSRVTAALDGTLFEQRDSYPSGTQDLGFLSYSPAAGTWSTVALDSTGNAIVLRGRATATGLEFEGDVTIVGVETHLRQTITRDGSDAYTVVNDERAADGSWRRLDRYRYTRITRR